MTIVNEQRHIVVVAVVTCALMALFACGPKNVPGPAPDPKWLLRATVIDDGRALPGVEVRIQDKPFVATTGTNGVADFGVIPQAGYILIIEADGYQRSETHVHLSQATHVDITLTKAAPPVVARRGVVRASGAEILDDDGPRLWIGTSLFWAVWGYEHDRDRLEKNLACLAGLTPERAECPKVKGTVDYVRILGTVGGAFWEPRAMDSRKARWRDDLAGFIDLAYDKYGIRTQVTIFGGVDFAPSASERSAVVDRVIAAVKPRTHKVFAIEVANEGWKNGFAGSAGASEARALARKLQNALPNLIAVTAPQTDACHDVPPKLGQVSWYGGGIGRIVTLHFDRSVSGDGGVWRPHRQPWREAAFRCDGVAEAYSSNEPIGPASSVNSETDPLRLVMGATVSFVAGVSAHVVHTGSGIRGLASPGRPANLWEVSGLGKVWAGVAAVRRLLPTTLGRGRSHNGHWSSAPMAVSPSDAFNTSVLRVFWRVVGTRFVGTPLQVRKAFTLTARRAMRVAVVHPLTGTVLDTHDLSVGQGFTLSASVPGVVLVGQFK